MNLDDARRILGEDYDNVSDESIQALLDLIEAVCIYVIETED